MFQLRLLTLALLVTLLAPSIVAQNLQLDSTLLTASDLVTGIQIPWEIKYGADDHLWVTERRGRILRVDPTTGNTTTVLNHEATVLEEESEYGMLGMALHPDFINTPKLYVVYCYLDGNIRERLVTFDWNGEALVNETIIFDDIPGGGIHNGSRILFTDDGKLLMTIGDRGFSSESQDMGVLNGKVLRMNLDGSLPDDNPIADSYIYSYGHRNQQGLAYGPNRQIYASEHGPQSGDEFNLLQANSNFGWPNVIGACNTAAERSFCEDNNVIEPLREWTPCVAVNDIIYYNHPAIPEWEGKMLMAVLGGFVRDPRLSVLTFNEDGTAVTAEQEVLDELGRIRDVAINPHTGSVYIATNGFRYPGEGPNRIIEYRNMDFVPVDVETVPTASQYLRLFPNPAIDRIQVDCSDSFLGAPYFIINTEGKVVQEGKLTVPVTEVDISNLAVGFHYLKASTVDGTISKAFVKE